MIIFVFLNVIAADAGATAAIIILSSGMKVP